MPGADLRRPDRRRAWRARRGQLWTFTEDPLAVKHYGPLTTKDGAASSRWRSAREAKDHLVATLKGVTDRNEAERLNGIELYVARDKLPATEDDEYYHADLIGLAAETTADEPLGRVIAIQISAPATSSRSRRPPARP